MLTDWARYQYHAITRPFCSLHITLIQASSVLYFPPHTFVHTPQRPSFECLLLDGAAADQLPHMSLKEVLSFATDSNPGLDK